jgi:tRNA threonylcarbamoyladenosine biosynthesis protein TsaE
MKKELLYEIFSDSPEKTEKIGADLAKELKIGDFVALVGDIGAGKTAFVRGMAEYITPGAGVCSPTYAIVNEYFANGKRLCHFDIYRLNDEDDLISIGFYDYDNCIKAVEWCDKIEEALPEEYYLVTILGSGEDVRNIKIEKVCTEEN